jgi:hypothetical protein
MNEFAGIIPEWETFYLLTGTAAATLIGLLFVAVSINIEVFHRRDFNDLQHFAALTFNCFFYVLLISILFLVPGLTPPGLSIPLGLLGLLGLVNALIQQRRVKGMHSNAHKRDLSKRFILPNLCMAALILIAMGVLLGYLPGLYWLVPVVILLLASASQNAWTLLVQTDGGRSGKK